MLRNKHRKISLKTHTLNMKGQQCFKCPPVGKIISLQEWLNVKNVSSSLLCSDIFYFSFQCKETYKHYSFLTSPEDEHCHVGKEKSETHDPSSLQCLKTKMTLNICISSRGTNTISTATRDFWELLHFRAFFLKKKTTCVRVVKLNI